MKWLCALSLVCLLATACSSETEPNKRASITVVCEPGDTVKLGFWEPNAEHLAQPVIYDNIVETTRYKGLIPGRWSVQVLKWPPVPRGVTDPWPVILKEGENLIIHPYEPK